MIRQTGSRQIIVGKTTVVKAPLSQIVLGKIKVDKAYGRRIDMVPL